MSTTSRTPTSLPGPWLWLARLGWAVGMLFYLALFIYCLPTYRYLLYLRATQEWAAFLPQAGFTTSGYIAFQLGLVITYVAIYTLAAFFLAWRRSDNGFTLAISVVMVAFAVYVSTLTPSFLGQNLASTFAYAQMDILQLLRPAWAWLIDLGDAGAFIGILAMLCLLPNGRWRPRWTLPLALVWSVWMVVGVFWPALSFRSRGYGLFSLAQMIFFSLGVLAQVLRYFRLSTPSQRQQTKWMFLGIVLIMASFLLYILPQLLLPVLRGSSWPALLWHLLAAPLFFFLPRLLFPFFLLFAMLRYRLWDVDFVINRSLVYGALTLLLLALCSLSIYLASALFKGLLGGPLVGVALSAGIFGALFRPLRQRAQRFVDQRFYHIAINYHQGLPPALKASEPFTFTRLGEYTNLTLIGRGGMAEVYRATHPTLKKSVAIKLLPAALVEQEDYRRRFAREARLIAQLEHPNIVRLFDFDAVQGAHYMVMEYLNGPSLSAWLKERGPLPLAEALPILRQVASALDYAHAQGIVHRDVKPSNVLLELLEGAPLRAVLTDFGVAKLLGGHTALTKTGLLGTFDYIAPEQIRAAADVDGRADIYSLGVMAYQMLTGRRPFEHENPGAQLIAHLSQPPPDPHQFAPHLPAAVAHALERALSKQPTERFDTAGEFVAAFE